MHGLRPAAHAPVVALDATQLPCHAARSSRPPPPSLRTKDGRPARALSEGSWLWLTLSTCTYVQGAAGDEARASTRRPHAEQCRARSRRCMHTAGLRNAGRGRPAVRTGYPARRCVRACTALLERPHLCAWSGGYRFICTPPPPTHLERGEGGQRLQAGQVVESKVEHLDISHLCA